MFGFQYTGHSLLSSGVGPRKAGGIKHVSKTELQKTQGEKG